MTAALDAAPLPAAPRGDFPPWLPPMLVKELRQGLRSRWLVAGMVTVHTGMALLLGWVLLNPGRQMADAAQAVRGLMWFAIGLMLLLITPRRAESLGAEVRERTMDPLLLTQLDGTRIVLGKWASLLAQAALVVVALLPYGLLQYYFGDMDVAGDLTALGGLLLASAALTAGALLFSTLARWQTTVVGAGGLALLVIGPVFVFFFKLASAPPTGFLMFPPTLALVALGVYDAALAAVLSLVVAAWRLDRRDRSRMAWRLVLLTLPPAGLGALHSGWCALAQGCVCLALTLTTLVAAPRRRKKLREPAAPRASSAAPEPAAFVSPPVATVRAQTIPPPPPAAGRADFPFWLPPMLVKELRQGLRTKAFVAIFILVQLLMAGAFLYAIFGTNNARDSVETTSFTYWTVLNLLILVIGPLRARGVVAAELKDGQADFLLLTRLSGLSIVTGQWVSLMTQTLLLTVSLLPYGLVRYYQGGVELYADTLRLGGMLLASGLFTALVFLFSVMRWSQRIALVAAGFFFLIPFSLAMTLVGIMAFFPEWLPLAGISLVVCNAVFLTAQCLLSVGRFIDPQRSVSPKMKKLVVYTLIPGALLGFVSVGLVAVQAVFAGALATIAGIMSPYQPSSGPWQTKLHASPPPLPPAAS